jgi:hypothetical protein
MNGCHAHRCQPLSHSFWQGKDMVKKKTEKKKKNWPFLFACCTILFLLRLVLVLHRDWRVTVAT